MYVTLANAKTYITANKLETTSWDASSDAQKTKALTIATSIIDRLNYAGVANSDAAAFPRDDEDEVPQDIIDACCEIAYSLIDDVDIEMERQRQFLASDGAASIKTQYKNLSQEHILAGVPSSIAWDLLKPYLRDISNITMFRIN